MIPLMLRPRCDVVVVNCLRQMVFVLGMWFALEHMTDFECLPLGFSGRCGCSLCCGYSRWFGMDLTCSLKLGQVRQASRRNTEPVRNCASNNITKNPLIHYNGFGISVVCVLFVVGLIDFLVGEFDILNATNSFLHLRFEIIKLIRVG